MPAMQQTKMDLLEFLISQFTRLPGTPAGTTLEGKTVILTGANSGIGYAAAHELASLRPARLILACRNLASGADALDSVLKSYPGTKAEVWELDLASFASVKAFGERAAREAPVLDVAILNAGINLGPSTKSMPKTEDGHELTHQVNVLSTILLALLLTPLLKRSPDPSLVITSSEVHAWAHTEVIERAVKGRQSLVGTIDDPEQFILDERYPLSKLLLQLIVRKLLPILPVRLVSVNPRLCRSNLGRDYPLAFKVGMNVLGCSAASGGHIVVSAAFSPQSTEYWHLCEPHGLPSKFMATKTGYQVADQYYAEVLDVLERAVPGSTGVVRGGEK